MSSSVASVGGGGGGGVALAVSAPCNVSYGCAAYRPLRAGPLLLSYWSVRVGGPRSRDLLRCAVQRALLVYRTHPAALVSEDALAREASGLVEQLLTTAACAAASNRSALAHQPAAHNGTSVRAFGLSAWLTVDAQQQQQQQQQQRSVALSLTDQTALGGASWWMDVMRTQQCASARPLEMLLACELRVVLTEVAAWALRRQPVGWMPPPTLYDIALDVCGGNAIAAAPLAAFGSIAAYSVPAAAAAPAPLAMETPATVGAGGGGGGGGGGDADVMIAELAAQFDRSLRM